MVATSLSASQVRDDARVIRADYPSPSASPHPCRIPAWRPPPFGRLREVRVTYRPSRAPVNRSMVVTRPEDLFRAFSDLALEAAEVFRVVFLDQRGGLLAFEDIARGTVSRLVIHPREVFHSAIQLRASAVIAMHNHPDQAPQPSRQDRIVTSKLRRAGEVLGIPLLDHIIVAEEGFYSFHDSEWHLGCGTPLR